METFDASTNGSFTFSFCDVIADVFIAAFSNADDLATKAVCLRKLLTLGYSHNRYYVRDSLMMLLSGLSDADVAI
ncbi:hypothetical protein, partial [Amycolatopsis magusensis]|uniref:hypothetical protein n=1 Tax=Amycolatopsis magusensis TaxID=882444 RepID=UPI0024A7C1EF